MGARLGGNPRAEPLVPYRDTNYAANELMPFVFCVITSRTSSGLSFKQLLAEITRARVHHHVLTKVLALFDYQRQIRGLTEVSFYSPNFRNEHELTSSDLGS